jgi:hypothetical protein
MKILQRIKTRWQEFVWLLQVLHQTKASGAIPESYKPMMVARRQASFVWLSKNNPIDDPVWDKQTCYEEGFYEGWNAAAARKESPVFVNSREEMLSKMGWEPEYDKALYAMQKYKR